MTTLFMDFDAFLGVAQAQLPGSWHVVQIHLFIHSLDRCLLKVCCVPDIFKQLGMIQLNIKWIKSLASCSLQSCRGKADRKTRSKETQKC
jgi:hypothetical protein